MSTKYKFPIFILFLSVFLLNSCLFNFDNYLKYTSLYINLVNNSSVLSCSKDSIDVTFLVSNNSTDTTKKVKAEVKSGKTQSINVFIKRDEFLKVKVFNTKDSTLLVEKEFKVGKGVYQWNDPPPRTITFCKTLGLKFENF